jgi:hypothetical protein
MQRHGFYRLRHLKMVCASRPVRALMRLVAHAPLAYLQLHVTDDVAPVLPVVSRALRRQCERQRMHQQLAEDFEPPLRELEIKFTYDKAHLVPEDVVALDQLSSRLTALAIGPVYPGMCSVDVRAFGDAELAALLAPLPLLRRLELWVNSSLSRGVLRLVGEHCALLERLTLKGVYDLGALRGDSNVSDNSGSNNIDKGSAAMPAILRRPLFPCLTALDATSFEPREPLTLDESMEYEYEPQSSHPVGITYPLLPHISLFPCTRRAMLKRIDDTSGC